MASGMPIEPQAQRLMDLILAEGGVGAWMRGRCQLDPTLDSLGAMEL